jgi:glycine reductase
MAKEIEKVGIPTVQICTMTQVAWGVGSPRITLGRSVLHPTGDPSLPPDAERAQRRAIVVEALHALRTKATEPEGLPTAP